MGLGASDDDSNDQLDRMIQANQIELENKRQELFRERMSIEKSQGLGTFKPEPGPIRKALYGKKDKGQA